MTPAKKSADASQSYTTKNIIQPDPMEYIRMKVGVYLPGEPKDIAFREIFDNAFDEVIGGYGTTVEIIDHGDGSFTVTDDGRGLPVDTNDKGINGIILTVGTPASGGKFEQSDGVSAGTNGVGSSATNAISQRFSVTVHRDGKRYHQDFCRGVPGKFAGDTWDPYAEFTPESSDLKGVKDLTRNHGTSIRFTFDDTVVGDSSLHLDEVLDRARDIARLIDGARLVITHSDGDTEVIEGQYGTDAVFRAAMGKEPTIALSGETSYVEKGRTKPLNWRASLNTDAFGSQKSFVNNVLTHEGGSHINALAKAVGSVMESRVTKVRGLELKKGEEPPLAEDFADTMNAVLSITTPDASFDSQGKRAISSRPLYNAMVSSVTDSATKWINDKSNASTVLAWCKAAQIHSRHRRSAQQSRNRAVNQVVNSSGLGENMSMPSKLIPSRVSGRQSGAELFICEGNSARGTLVSARNSDFQAVLPIRGKFLNAYNTTAETALKNNEISSIATVMGCGIGDQCDPEKCRYDRIFMATDADPDGEHIKTLLVILFYEHFRPLLDAGMIYATHPPLWVMRRGKEVYYAVDDNEKEEIIEDLKSKKVSLAGMEYERCKGLGQMEPDDFSNTVMDPEKRHVTRVVTTESAEQMYETMDLLFSKKNADDRKDWFSTVLADIDFDYADIRG